MKNILDLVGNTPVVKLNALTNDKMAQVYVKLEKFNLSGSVKDRAALAMIEEAKLQGKLNSNSIILEPTSGNTGISLALIARLMGYKACIVMPDTMSKERRDLIKTFGADLILTSGKDGMKGAINKALELAKSDNRYIILQQFENPANTKAHYTKTAEEIIKEFKTLDYFVAGVGTGGTISGVGKRLKEHFKDIKVIAIEPEQSPMLSKNTAGAHKIQGIGAGFVPAIYDASVVDDIVCVDEADAINMVRLLASKEGLLLGISSGASIFAALELAKTLPNDKKILAIAPDGGEKYISMGIFDV
ncbi:MULTISPECIES: cysteine synthase A [unclassified Campylobacter]|uniref:cysteine synthase A n=1 Tax=unclassified Campylobacter TaxID=2593542 RepID=UPI001BDA8ED7|nr:MULTISPECIES: cysteine synthase A [unclassified Campylobacter]MBT0878768.1 cysteine synthase A [Campylobacter sp. 2018MI01]MBT0881072.1 cysteine synthase A [Campylobacter sp. 2018MI27]MBT0883774.1 cysteine synthase A [Campylobacter sp. 2018MI10]MBZ8008190.1 cysteine synthase A [Campylobacter sp. RM9334]